jgi:hypothetical protein
MLASKLVVHATCKITKGPYQIFFLGSESCDLKFPKLFLVSFQEANLISRRKTTIHFQFGTLKRFIIWNIDSLENHILCIQS